jgi:hypothetical protein|tara:strand:+ start:576 stop:791 length:216 start_codon:yes stop_codon:yes gene_type:complete
LLYYPINNNKGVKMKITLTNESGCSFTFDDIPDVNTAKDMKDYLWSDVTTNHLFQSREDLDTKWKVEKELK